jgi:hypothetical protein
MAIALSETDICLVFMVFSNEFYGIDQHDKAAFLQTYYGKWILAFGNYFPIIRI